MTFPNLRLALFYAPLLQEKPVKATSCATSNSTREKGHGPITPLRNTI